MRTVTFLAAALVAAGPLAAQAAPAAKPAKPAEHGHADHAADHGKGGIPAGWSLRADRGDTAGIRMMPMGDEMHVMTGPATILWRAADAVSGNFHAVANFTRPKAPAHAEAYGLFFRGRSLDGAGQQYTYFLVRGDGKYLIKVRDGAETRNVVEGWTEHAAVARADSTGKVTDKLEIDATTPGKVRFLVNGQAVHEAAMSAEEIGGAVGLRVNHNLMLHVAGFEVHKM
ncbi:MAG TPA: hypothetical protein VFU00_09355 [Gemmatimonadales bacterium]|nr:hypothetical protein [Gemmatimonadales bacterium]